LHFGHFGLWCGWRPPDYVSDQQLLVRYNSPQQLALDILER